jgi:hypothetical protein
MLGRVKEITNQPNVCLWDNHPCLAPAAKVRFPPFATVSLRLRTTPEAPLRITARSYAAGPRFAPHAARDVNGGCECAGKGRLRWRECQIDMGSVRLHCNAALLSVPSANHRFQPPPGRVLQFGVKVQSFGSFLDKDICEIWHGYRVSRGGTL